MLYQDVIKDALKRKNMNASELAQKNRNFKGVYFANVEWES